MTVTLEEDRGVPLAVIDDGRANALSFEVITGLRAALAAAVDAGVPLVMTGRDGYFSAGFDLKVMRSGDRELVSSLTAQGILLFQEVFAAPIPVLAACTGHALAAGALLLLAADYRIGRPGTYQIGLNETRIGIALPQFAVDMARLRLNPNHLLAATALATITSPDQACAFGYLDRLEADPRSAASSLAEELASAGLKALARTKLRMNAAIVGQLER